MRGDASPLNQYQQQNATPNWQPEGGVQAIAKVTSSHTTGFMESCIQDVEGDSDTLSNPNTKGEPRKHAVFLIS
jgi:hypothetical protein